MREYVMGGHEEGPIVFRVPEKITEDDYCDLEYWVKGIMDQAKRRSVNKASGVQESNE